MSPNRLAPEASYVLRALVDACLGLGSASVIFRYPSWNQSFRTFTADIVAGSGSVIELPVMAFAFTGLAEVCLNRGSDQALLVKEVSLKKTSPTVKWTESFEECQASFVPVGYKLVSNDKFFGIELDQSKWFIRGMHANETIDHWTDKNQHYGYNGNYKLFSGRLSLVARQIGLGHESGMIRPDCTVRYGYFQARVKMPVVRGVLPVFWLNSDVAVDGYQSWPPELEIFEFVHNGAEDTGEMLHSGVINHLELEKSKFLYADPAFNMRWAYWKALYSFDGTWHTIDAEWTKNAFSTSVVGKKIVERAYQWRYVDGRPAAKAHIVLNLAVSDDWAGRTASTMPSFRWASRSTGFASINTLASR